MVPLLLTRLKHLCRRVGIGRVAVRVSTAGGGVGTEGRAEREWLRVTLASIGDAVVTTDTAGRVTFLNPVAEELVGWKTGEAAGRTLEDVFRIVNETTRQTVENPPSFAPAGAFGLMSRPFPGLTPGATTMPPLRG
mgnify:CR=1 FL=1